MSNSIPPAPKTVRLHIEVPQDRLDAFHRLYCEFNGGETSQDQAIRQRATDRNQGIASLRELVRIAQGSSGQCRYIARFLAGLYNGPRFPFDLTDLRPIDDELFEHAMAVLRMDHAPEQEVHQYFVDGGALWEERIIKEWSLDRQAAEHAAYVLAGFLKGSDDPELSKLGERIDAWRERERRDG